VQARIYGLSGLMGKDKGLPSNQDHRKPACLLVKRAANVIFVFYLEHSTVLFAWWHQLREGTWARATFQWYMGGLRRSFREELERGSRCRCPKTAASCLELLARERAPWTFVRVEGIEPTN
jgi:hypothetical protein